MKKLILFFIFSGLFTAISAQNNHSLLWKVTGKNLKKPSYLFGTMHLICADDIILSDSLKNAIRKADNVYLELDMNNLMEMMGAMTHMQMRNDTTLSDLLTKEDYAQVKSYFSAHAGMVPFSMLETFKPLLTESMIMEQSATCDHLISMEQLIMEEAKTDNVEIKGLETMNFQLSIFDSIPYKYQADQLVDMVKNSGKPGGDEDDMAELTKAYKDQELDTLEELTKKEDAGMEGYANLLLYNRNATWAAKLNGLFQQYSLVVAVGAGHLPGPKGVISLLRKMGYTVEPVNNVMIKKTTKDL